MPLFSPSDLNEFNFENFLSTFDNDKDDDNENLSKYCRELLTSHSNLNKQFYNDNISSNTRSGRVLLEGLNQKFNEEVNVNLASNANKNRDEIFISIETDQNETDPHLEYEPFSATSTQIAKK